MRTLPWNADAFLRDKRPRDNCENGGLEDNADGADATSHSTGRGVDAEDQANTCVFGATKGRNGAIFK
jgi:hypothetical protein